MTRRKKLLFLAVLLVSAALLADTLHRAALAARGAMWRPSDIRSAIATSVSVFESGVADPDDARETDVKAEAPGERRSDSLPAQLHPFFGFSVSADPFGVLDYFSKPEQREKDWVILLLGGSVATGCSHVGNVVERAVKDHPRLEGRTPRLVNWAHPAYKQPQQVNVLTYLLSLGHTPDAVINLDGFNEVALSHQNAAMGSRSDFPAYPQWAPLAADASARNDLRSLAAMVRLEDKAKRIAATTVRGRLYWSSLIGNLQLARVDKARGGWATEYDSYLAKLNQGDQLLLEAETIVDTQSIRAGVRSWYQGSRTLNAICEDRSIVYLHVLQPTLHDEGAKLVTPEELKTGKTKPSWMRAVREGYPMMRATGIRLEEEGIPHLDASRVFRSNEETLYYDACHFSARGRRILMKRIGDELRERLDEQPTSGQ